MNDTPYAQRIINAIRRQSPYGDGYPQSVAKLARKILQDGEGIPFRYRAELVALFKPEHVPHCPDDMKADLLDALAFIDPEQQFWKEAA